MRNFRLRSVLIAFCLITMPLFGAHANFLGDIAKAFNAAFEEFKSFVSETDIKIEPGIGTDVSIVSIDISPGISIIPNKDKKTYQRKESLELKAGVKDRLNAPGDLPAFFNTGLSADARVEFIRNFESQKAAANLIKNKPYNLINIPITAERALDNDKFKVGDYASFKSEMDLRFGVGLSQRMGLATASTTLGYLVRGDFFVEAYKISEDKMFLRATAMRRSSLNGGVSVKLGLGVEIFGIEEIPTVAGKPIEKLITKQLVPRTPLTLTNSEGAGDLFVVEYIFNLSDQRARKAYNKVLKLGKADIFKGLINPFSDDEELLETLIMDFKEADELAEESDENLDFDKNGNVDIKKIESVAHLIRGRSEFEERKTKMKFDLKFITQLEGNHSEVTQDFKFKLTGNGKNPDGSEGVKSYRIGDYVDNFKAELFVIFNSHTRREANILFELDENDRIKRFVELGFHFSRDENMQRGSEYGWMKEILRRLLPFDFHDHLNIEEFFGEEGFRRNAQTEIDLIFFTEALRVAEKMSVKDIKKVVFDYIQLLADHQATWGQYYGRLHPKPSAGSSRGFHKDFEKELKQIKRIIPAIYARDGVVDGLRPGKDVDFDEKKVKGSRLSPEERWSAFSKLKGNIMFNIIGPGILSRIVYAGLLQQTGSKKKAMKQFWEVATFTFKNRSRKQNPIEFVYGSGERSEEFKRMVGVKNRLTRRRHRQEFFDQFSQN